MKTSPASLAPRDSKSRYSAASGRVPRWWWRGIACAGVFSAAAGCADAAQVRYVIQISIDGLRADALQSLMNAAPASYSGFGALRSQGASTFNARCDVAFSETVPNHGSMLMGRPVQLPALPGGGVNPAQHGYSNNFPGASDTFHNQGNPVGYKASVFDVVHDNGLSTALYAGKSRLLLLERSYNAAYGAADTTGADNGRDKIDVHSIPATGSLTSSASLVTEIVNAVNAGTLKRYTFLHIIEPDSAGHSSNWGSATWNTAVQTTDGLLNQILTAVKNSPDYATDTAILVTGDHGGGGGTSNTHTDATRAENCRVPFFVWGPGFAAGANLYQHFSNRHEPEIAVLPSYAEIRQPLRNGDAPNLSLALLGLPSIPGSSLLPELALIDIRVQGALIDIRWPSAAVSHQLEAAMDPGGPWTPVSQGITESNAQFHYQESATPGAKRFFRLRKL